MPKILDKLAELAKTFSSVDNSYKVNVKSPNIIGFYAPHAGAGCSSLLASVANELHTPVEPVCIVDLDFIARTQANYFLANADIAEERSILRRITNPGVSVAELINYKNDSTANIGVVGNSGVEHPLEWCSPTTTNFYKDLLESLSHQFSYVLVDIPSCINSDECIYGLLCCDTVYSVVKPISAHITELLYIKEIIQSSTPFRGARDKIKPVIQTQVNGNAYPANIFAANNLELKMNTFQDLDLMTSFDNTELPSSITNKNVKIYLEGVKHLAEEIKQSVSRYKLNLDKSDESNE